MREAVVWVLAVAICVTLVRILLVQSFVVPSGSMEQTLKIGDRVLVSRIDYRLGSVHRGDVIVFNGDGVFDPASAPPTGLAKMGRTVASWLGAPVDERDYVKRVIGLPGDRVVCCDTSGLITVNGTALHEPYLYPGDIPSATHFDVTVPPGRLFVLGDHRGDSADSRAHLGDPGGGTVPLDHVVGRVVAIWWPLGDATGIGGGSSVFTSAAGREESP